MSKYVLPMMMCTCHGGSSKSPSQASWFIMLTPLAVCPTRRYGDKNLFPIKAQIPLILTVYLMMTVSAFQRLTLADIPANEFFDVPSEYAKKTVHDVFKNSKFDMENIGW